MTGLNEWRCAACGETHADLPAATLRAPAAWLEASEDERNEEFQLTSDACIWRAPDDEHFFVRCVLSLPFVDREGTFDFGVWSTLSRENFARYVESYGTADRELLGAMFGWFSNRLPGYPETLNLKCTVNPREPGMRPTIELEPTQHPLSVQQRDGLKFQDAVAYCHEYMGL